MVRYGTHVWGLSLEFGMKLLRKAVKERNKRDCWEMWLARLPGMTQETYKPFESFYDEKEEYIPEKKDMKDLIENQDNVMDKIKNGQYRKME